MVIGEESVQESTENSEVLEASTEGNLEEGTPDTPVDGGEESEDTPDGGEADDKSQFAPNYKYKVLDKEKEFPDLLREVVKTADDEKFVRELLEKADGIESVKEKREQAVKRYDELVENWAPAIQTIQKVDSLLKNGDLEGFFELSGISDQVLFNYVKQRLDLLQDPNKFSAHRETRDLTKQVQTLQAEKEAFQQSSQQQLAEMREQELQGHLSRPEVSAIAQAFDARAGRPGAFRAECIKRGQMYALVEKKDVPVQDVVDEICQIWAPLSAQQPAPVANPTQNPDQTVVRSADRHTKPSIPSVRGQGGSPTSVRIKSIDDIKKIRKQKYGS